MREVMSLRQCAEYLGVSSEKMYALISQENIPAFKIGNRWRIKKALLDAWIEQKSARGM